MKSRALVSLLAASGLCAMGVTVAQCPPPPVQTQYVNAAGHAEPHTPGSGAPAELPASVAVQRVLGADPDLNRVTVLRSFLPKPSGAPPRAIVILVPGFLGGATNFTPLAEQLVRRFNGNLEVWAVDRRMNQLEDRRGALHGRERLAANDVGGFLDALQFYFPDTLTGPNPFPTNQFDSDVNQNGVQDPPFALPDALGGATAFQQLGQDDARFAAYWGLDTWFRDWKVLVDQARSVVGPTGLVLFGGHSAGTGFSGQFAAYDFDPGPGVDAAHDHIDGLLLLEGGGPGAGSASVTFQANGVALPSVPRPASAAAYDALVAQLAAPGGPDVFMASFFFIPLAQLGAGAELSGLDGFYRGSQESFAQRVSLLKGGTLFLLLGAPMDADMPIPLFIDDDFSPVAQLSGSFGFSDDGPNSLFALFGNYLANDPQNGTRRSWKNFDDPTLPTCPPHLRDASDGTGCAILDRGPKADLVQDGARWGVTAEPSDLRDLLANQFGETNFLEWYYQAGRLALDSSYGRDSSALGDESRLAITQNATMDKPVLAIGGSNGLAPLESSFQGYLSSIATPAADKQIHISEGYAHLDPLTATNNDAVPVIVDWVNRLLQRKLLGQL
jgi:hypothetical protein